MSIFDAAFPIFSMIGFNTPEIAAKYFRLPIEAVQEALDYYQQNQELIHAEVTEEGRRLQEAGLLGD